MNFYSKDPVKFLRVTARILLMIWTGFWLYFGMASGFVEQANLQDIIIHTIFPGGIFLVISAVAFKWEYVGGILLIVIGVITAIGYPLIFAKGRVDWMLTVTPILALPPLIAGILLLRSHFKVRNQSQ